MGFFMHNTAAICVGIAAAGTTHYLNPELALIDLAAVGICGYLGGHLPKIQQPTLPAYRIIRFASWLATLFIPLALFSYRPTDLLLGWMTAFLFTSGMWMIIDRVSLRRDYTHSLMAIWLLPLGVTGCAYLGLGQTIVLPAFLACSAGYLIHLLLEQLTQSKKSSSYGIISSQKP